MIFNRYLENLKDVKEISLPDDTNQYSWLAIPFMYNDRMKLLTYLENNNIQTRVCMAGNVTRHPAYREFLTEFKNSDIIMAEAFLLGAHHGMTIEDVDYVCTIIKTFINKNDNKNY
jgi:CDP-6-deoxy-D-xylo-4-hexulose-3-dehydrase